MGKRRWRNYGLWISVASLVGVLIRIKYPTYLDEWTDFSTLLLTILVLAGIISNPKTTNRWYRDDKVDTNPPV
jgi:uncharacterized membrane protein